MTSRKKAAVPRKTPTAGSAEQRRKLFIEAFLSNGENVTEAALAAGFAPKSASSQGSRLLKTAKVKAEIDKRRAEIIESIQDKTNLTVARVLESLAHAVLFDPRKLYREDGTLKPVNELDDATAMALTGFEIVEEYAPNAPTELEPQAHGGGLKRFRRTVVGHTAKVKWLDKNTAREQALKHLGLFDKDNRQRIDPLLALLAAVNPKAVTVVATDPDHQ